jgi:hypothetical protein
MIVTFLLLSWRTISGSTRTRYKGESLGYDGLRIVEQGKNKVVKSLPFWQMVFVNFRRRNNFGGQIIGWDFRCQ